MTFRVIVVVCLFVGVSLAAQVSSENDSLPPLPEIDVHLMETPKPVERELELFANRPSRIETDANYPGINGRLLLDGESDAVLEVFAEKGGIRFLTSGSERMRITQDGLVSINGTDPYGARLFVQHGKDRSKAVFVTHQTVFEAGSSPQNEYGVYIQTHQNVHTGVMNSGTVMGGYLNALATGPGTLAQAVGAFIEAGTYLPAGTATGGTLTSAIAARLDIRAEPGTTITNGYGLVIDDINATNDWAVYQTHSSDDNYFAGRIGIGTTSPDAKLHIAQNSDTSESWLIIEDTDDTAGSQVPRIEFQGNGMTLGFFRYDHTGARFRSAADVDLVAILDGGNVGIGTATPSQKLHVNGNVLASGMTVTGNIVANGSITGATVIGAVYQDVAEWVPASVEMEPGTVVVLNHERANEVMPSRAPYDTSVAGVVSAQPGVLLGIGGESKEQISTTGRVKVRVDATRAPIRIGDLLVTSDVPGTAMKSSPIEIAGTAIHRPGTIIGKALEPLESGTGEILVLLSLQ